jgi:hypothetical protein
MYHVPHNHTGSWWCSEAGFEAEGGVDGQWSPTARSTAQQPALSPEQANPMVHGDLGA